MKSRYYKSKLKLWMELEIEHFLRGKKNRSMQETLKGRQEYVKISNRIGSILTYLPVNDAPRVHVSKSRKELMSVLLQLHTHA